MAGEVWTREWPAEPGWYWVANVPGRERTEPALVKVIGSGPIASWRGGLIFQSDAVLWGPRIEKPEGPARTSSLA